jgi:hypothetical protein
MVSGDRLPVPDPPPVSGALIAIDEVVVAENVAALCVKPVVVCAALEEADELSDFSASKIVDAAPIAANMSASS